jgi:hypothetical protein
MTPKNVMGGQELEFPVGEGPKENYTRRFQRFP